MFFEKLKKVVYITGAMQNWATFLNCWWVDGWGGREPKMVKGTA